MVNELITTVLPDGNTGQCRALHENSTPIAIAINDILEIGEKYTFSIFVKAYTSGSSGQCGVNQNSTMIAYTDQWTHIQIPFEAISTDLQVVFTAGVCVYKAKLEKGSVATVWNYSEADKELFMQTQGIGQWCFQNDITKIDGGKIATGTITADKIDVNNLFAKNITATGIFNIDYSTTDRYGNIYSTRIINDRGNGLKLEAVLERPNWGETHVGSLEIQPRGVEIVGTVNSDNIYDDYWHDVNYASEFECYNSSDIGAEYTCVNGQVFIRGIAKPKATITGGYTTHTLFTLPEGYRPSKPLQFLCQGSIHYIWLLTIGTNGVVSFSRYRDGNGFVNATNKTWLPFNVSFILDNVTNPNPTL